MHTRRLGWPAQSRDTRAGTSHSAVQWPLRRGTRAHRGRAGLPGDWPQRPGVFSGTRSRLAAVPPGAGRGRVRWGSTKRGQCLGRRASVWRPGASVSTTELGATASRTRTPPRVPPRPGGHGSGAGRPAPLTLRRVQRRRPCRDDGRWDQSELPQRRAWKCRLSRSRCLARAGAAGSAPGGGGSRSARRLQLISLLVAVAAGSLGTIGTIGTIPSGRWGLGSRRGKVENATCSVRRQASTAKPVCEAHTANYLCESALYCAQQ